MNGKYSRFVFNKRHLSRVPTPHIKADAFIVAPEVKASVYQTDLLTEVDIWQIGSQLAERRAPISLKGRGDVSYEDIVVAGLDVEVDNISPVAPHLHRNIIGWGSNDKAQQLEKALKLAAKATALFPD